MSKANTAQQAGYAAFDHGGVFCGVVVDQPEHHDRAVDAVHQWLNDGLTIHRVTVEWARTHPLYGDPCEPAPHGAEAK